MKFDLNQTGLRRIFSAWQVEIMEYLWKLQMPVKSADVHRYLEKKGVHTTHETRNTVSRASCINFMNSLVDDGVLTYVEKTGKGGYRKIYSLVESVETKTTFKLYVQRKILAALRTFIKDE